MSLFGWLVLLVCFVAAGVAYLPGWERVARGLGWTAVGLLVLLLAQLVWQGSFDDLLSVGAQAWLRATLSVCLPVVGGLGLLWLLRRFWK